MDREPYFKKLFLYGAIWNWVVTLSLGFGYEPAFSLLGMDLPLYPVFLQLFLGLAFVFGIGYFWVYQDLTQNHAIVKMGIMGKTIVFVWLLNAAMKGNISYVLVAAGFVDQVFAVLYAEFLIHSWRNQ